ncbi:MAG: hypothetical protein AABZ64_09525 [Nitrospinota bacterium]
MKKGLRRAIGGLGLAWALAALAPPAAPAQENPHGTAIIFYDHVGHGKERHPVAAVFDPSDDAPSVKVIESIFEATGEGEARLLAPGLAAERRGMTLAIFRRVYGAFHLEIKAENPSTAYSTETLSIETEGGAKAGFVYFLRIKQQDTGAQFDTARPGGTRFLGGKGAKVEKPSEMDSTGGGGGGGGGGY